MPLNTERPLFANLNMRLAVNYAVDRTAYGDAAGRYRAAPFDQYLPPGMPGYEDIDVYPAHPDLERARDLAGWHPGDPLRPITVYYRSSGAVNLAQYDIVRQNLEAIGFQVTGVGWAGGEIYHRMGIRGEPFDLGVSTGWCSDYSDPWDWLFLYDGTTIHDGENNLNYSYFNDPVFNERMHAAAELIGDERYDAFRDIEHDLVRDAAPSASMRTLQRRRFLLAAHRVPALPGVAVLRSQPDQPLPAAGDHDRRHACLRARPGGSCPSAPEQRDGQHDHGRLRDRRRDGA